MYDPNGSFPSEQRRHVEAGVLALVLAEDWPWRASELAERLGVHVALVALAAETLSADGLLTVDGDELRASWAAVRADELLASPPESIKRRVCLPRWGAAIPI